MLGGGRRRRGRGTEAVRRGGLGEGRRGLSQERSLVRRGGRDRIILEARGGVAEVVEGGGGGGGGDEGELVVRRGVGWRLGVDGGRDGVEIGRDAGAFFSDLDF